MQSSYRTYANACTTAVNLVQSMSFIINTSMKKKLNLTVILHKYESWDRLLKYEEDYLRKKLRAKADSAFNAWIRDRDKWLWCVSYWASNCKNCVEHACHRIEAARYSHRRDENNVHGGCSTCNGYNKREHIMYYTSWMEHTYGKDG